MATWDRTIVGSNPTVMIRVEFWEDSYNVANNTSYVRYKLSFLTSNGSRSGTWDYWMNVNGGRVATASFGGTHSGWQTVVDSGYTHGHDVNGNASASAEGFGDAYYGSGSTGGSIGLTRLGMAPSIAGISADTISVQSVRLGMEFNNYGRGTSAASRMYYRVQGSGSGWSQTPDQGDGAGWTYWNVTGLAPATTYEYFTRAWNNNGDTGDSGAQTFTTLPPPSTSNALLKVVGVI